MIWRNSLPARVALATTGLLALLMLVIIGLSYAATALMLQEGVDQALLAAAPTRTGPVSEILSAAKRHEEDGEEWEKERKDRTSIQVLDPSGVIRFGTQSLPVDPKAMAAAQRERVFFTSVVADDDHWQPRRGPDWLQALTPQEDQLRVMYAVAGPESEPVVIQMAAPLGMVSEVLPDLVTWLAALGAVGIVVAGLVAWRMAAKIYRPLRSIIATTDDISTRTPSVRIPDLWPDQTLRRLVGVLNAMINRLQAAFATQGQFVASAAHELRGPLAAMRTELEVALRRERSGEEYRAALNGALAETSRLTALSEHLLTLARYERGAGLAMVADVNLSALMQQAAQEVERSTGGQVEVVCPPDLLVDGDPISLERLISNLARNGVIHGGTSVRVQARQDGNGVAIAVADQGPGIAPEDLPHLYEPFFRADPARGREGGTGLGLAIVKAVVEAHGGCIAVEATPGKGATFRVWLPRNQRG